MKALLKVAMLGLSLTVTSACSNLDPIENPTSSLNSLDNLSSNEIKESIVAGCKGEEWRIIKADSTRVIAAKIAADKTATVEIEYSTDGYTINWKDSSGTLTRQESKISPKYNSWVKRLRIVIDDKLSKRKALKI